MRAIYGKLFLCMRAMVASPSSLYLMPIALIVVALYRGGSHRTITCTIAGICPISRGRLGLGLGAFRSRFSSRYGIRQR